ncbi:MAG: hypothetical protein J6386_10175 [Candidatus Synoicihabitans palmerolidicus]|nr:hypothetical protein [Candidatus Synoicihabitans palmerolidicus]
MKIAIIILTDPLRGSQEALTRMLNALAMANECQRAGDTTEIVFAGTGTRWPAELSKLTYPANGIYESVRTLIKGASRSCAMRTQAVEGQEEAGVELLGDNMKFPVRRAL